MAKFRLPRIVRIRSHVTSRRFSGFTLVELVVVVTVLAILAIVGFLSLSGYVSDARRSTVLSNVRTVEEGLMTTSAVTGNFPVPSDAQDVTYSGGIAWKQGTAGYSVMAAIGMGEPPTDPFSKSEFAYSVTPSGLEFQISSAYLVETAAAPGVVTAYAEGVAEPFRGRKFIASVGGNHNGLFVPVRTQDSANVLIAVPSIILAELPGLGPVEAFVLDGRSGTPASWSGSVALGGTTGTGTPFSPTVVFSSTGSSFPTTGPELESLVNNLVTAYSGTAVGPDWKYITILHQPDAKSVVQAAGINALGRGVPTAPPPPTVSCNPGETVTGGACGDPHWTSVIWMTSMEDDSILSLIANDPGETPTCSNGLITIGQEKYHKYRYKMVCGGGVVAPWNSVGACISLGKCATATYPSILKAPVPITDTVTNNILTYSTAAAYYSTLQKARSKYSIGFNGSTTFNAKGDAPGKFVATGDLTFEASLYLSGTTTSQFPFLSYGGIVLYVNKDTNQLQFYENGYRISGPPMAANVWHHVALVRDSGVFKLFVDGTMVPTTYASSLTIDPGTSGITIQLGPQGGYLDGLRITKSVARYTQSFSTADYGHSYPAR